MTAAPNGASQMGNIAMCFGANCLGDVKRVTIICTFGIEQKISCWLGPGAPLGR
jgi:hypothetical protein